MALTQQHRSAIYDVWAPQLGEEVTEALIAHFPARDLDEPVTKEFVDLRIADVEVKIAELRTEVREGDASLRADIAELRSETRTERANLRTEMSEGDARLSKEMHQGFTRLSNEIHAGGVQLGKEITRLGNEMHAGDTQLGTVVTRVSNAIHELSTQVGRESHELSMYVHTEVNRALEVFRVELDARQRQLVLWFATIVVSLAGIAVTVALALAR